jgi:hypothetical protein
MAKKIIVDFFVVIKFKISQFDKIDLYGEVRGHSELGRQIYGERFPQSILPNASSRFRRFEMNKRDFGR